LFPLASHHPLSVKHQLLDGTTSGFNCTIWRIVIPNGLLEVDGGCVHTD